MVESGNLYHAFQNPNDLGKYFHLQREYNQR